MEYMVIHGLIFIGEYDEGGNFIINTTGKSKEYIEWLKFVMRNENKVIVM